MKEVEYDQVSLAVMALAARFVVHSEEFTLGIGIPDMNILSYEESARYKKMDQIPEEKQDLLKFCIFDNQLSGGMVTDYYNESWYPSLADVICRLSSFHDEYYVADVVDLLQGMKPEDFDALDSEKGEWVSAKIKLSLLLEDGAWNRALEKITPKELIGWGMITLPVSAKDLAEGNLSMVPSSSTEDLLAIDKAFNLFGSALQEKYEKLVCGAKTDNIDKEIEETAQKIIELKNRLNVLEDRKRSL